MSNRPWQIWSDMGGTSTDVSRFDGEFEYVFEHQVGPVKLAAPALAIETVAAGGGSICRVEQGRLAEAIRHISVRKGIDPAGYSLVAFGGAGGQHACRVAELLGMEEVILQMVHLLAISRELPLPFRASVRVGAVSPYKEAA